jgi:hypothetical protein
MMIRLLLCVAVVSAVESAAQVVQVTDAAADINTPEAAALAGHILHVANDNTGAESYYLRAYELYVGIKGAGHHMVSL